MRPRPVDHLESVSRDYPGVWPQYDHFLAQRSELGGWPSWCHCPMAGAYAVVSGGRDNTVPLSRALEVSKVAALAAWRPTQGIYRFDETLLDALWATPLTGDLPTDHLLRLPEWCVYVELPPSRGAHGFFAHLEHDAGDNRTELRLLIDRSDELAPLALHLGGGSIEGALAGFVAHANQQMAQLGMPVGLGPEVIGQLATLAGPLVSVLLYLCAEDAESVPTRGRGPLRPRLEGGRMRAARSLEVWEVGFDLGGRLREAEEAEHQGGSVRPHVRRAHWHSYWTGERRSERVVRWLSPMLVSGGPDRPTRRTAR